MAQIGAVVVTARPASGPGRQRLVPASRSRETVGAPGVRGAARSLWSRGRTVVHTAQPLRPSGLSGRLCSVHAEAAADHPPQQGCRAIEHWPGGPGLRGTRSADRRRSCCPCPGQGLRAVRPADRGHADGAPPRGRRRRVGARYVPGRCWVTYPAVPPAVRTPAA